MAESTPSEQTASRRLMVNLCSRRHRQPGQRLSASRERGTNTGFETMRYLITGKGPHSEPSNRAYTRDGMKGRGMRVTARAAAVINFVGSSGLRLLEVGQRDQALVAVF